MREWNFAALFGFFLTLHCHVALADHAAIRAPVCHRASTCDFDISLQEAQSSYQRHSENISKCLASARTEKEKKTCHILTTVTDRNICRSDETIGLYYFWAPMEDFSDGIAALSALRRRAKTGVLFGRDTVIVEADLSRENEQHLALCQVTSVSDIIGPPTDCVTVAIITPGKSWMRGWDRNPDGCYASPHFRETGAIDINWKISTHKNPAEFGDAVIKMLNTDLDMKTDMTLEKDRTGRITSVQLTSVAGIRDSKILPSGWREAMDFDIRIYVGGGNGSEIEIVHLDGVAHALVSRQALGSLTQYQGLDDVQRTIYAAQLDNKTGTALASVCHTYKKLSASTISCD